MELMNFPYQMNFEEYYYFKKLVNIWKNEKKNLFKNGIFVNCKKYTVLFTFHDKNIRIYDNNILKLCIEIEVFKLQHPMQILNILEHKKRIFKVKYEHIGIYVPLQKVYYISVEA